MKITSFQRQLSLTIVSGYRSNLIHEPDTRGTHASVPLDWTWINWKGNKMETKYTKAMDVEQAYDTAAWDDNIPSEGCYALAVAAAHELGGVETYNSNDGNSTISFAPTRTFEFNDSSSAQITYGGVYVID